MKEIKRNCFCRAKAKKTKELRARKVRVQPSFQESWQNYLKRTGDKIACGSMPFFKRLSDFVRKRVSIRIERRKAVAGDPHGFNAKERGEREQTMRALSKADSYTRIRKEWIDAVSAKSESMIGKTMKEKSVSRPEAERLLKKGNCSVKEAFQQGNVHYVLRYNFFDGKFYWSSTRRVSKRDERAPKAQAIW